MYRRDANTPHAPPGTAASHTGPGDDVMAIMGQFTDLLPTFAIDALVNFVVSQAYPTYSKQYGTPGETFWSNFTSQKAMCMELGIALEDTERVLELLLAIPSVSSYPGAFAFRWVKGSAALLAFTKFPVTCTIEFPSAYCQPVLDFYGAVWAALDAAKIPFTLHWGQMNNFTPERVRKMYGDDAVNTWIASRNKLVDANTRKVFGSSFLSTCGLA